MTVTWRVRLLQPTPAHVRKMLGLGPALRQALQVEGVRITDIAQGMLIEVPSPATRAHRRRWSLNRLCLLVYEHKNGQTYAWIKSVVESVIIAPATNGNGRH